MWDTILQVAGTAMSVFGQSQQSQAQQDAANYNAAAAEKEAEYQAWKNQVELDRLADLKNKLIARQTVMFAKAGVQLDEGTVSAVTQDTITQYTKDRELLKMQGDFSVQRAKAGAQISREEGDAAQTAGYLSMGRTLLQGASSVASAWGW